LQDTSPSKGSSIDLGLKDRRAFAAGASRGLGLACAKALADEGARVFICSRNTEELKRGSLRRSLLAASRLPHRPDDRRRWRRQSLDLSLACGTEIFSDSMPSKWRCISATRFGKIADLSF
jgi:NAD(P)-dependent dehydrogenase (short-subunit alcohol dehydrogenase family)